MPEAGHLDRRRLRGPAIEIPRQPGIVDGHGPDQEHEPGPELRRLADAVRLVTDQMVRTSAEPELLGRVAEAVEHAAAMLQPVTPDWVPHVSAKVSADGDPHGYFPFSPMIGWWNPLSPPIDLVVHDGVVSGRAKLGAAYEGPPGCVHGGVIAAIFDEVLGVANIAAGQGAMTGTLTVRYRRPTPLQAELTCEARTDRVEGRKVFASGEIRHDGEVTAEAEGIFIDVPPSKFTALADAHPGLEG